MNVLDSWLTLMLPAGCMTDKTKLPIMINGRGSSLQEQANPIVYEKQMTGQNINMSFGDEMVSGWRQFYPL